MRTKVLFDRLLPDPPATVLDVGGASGVYAGWLAERGHRAKIVDPVPLHVESARANGFRADRVRAFAEARRVVRPGGLVFGAAISRWASMYEALFKGLVDSPDFAGLVRTDLATGVRRNTVHLADGFTTVYFHRPEELPGEVADAGLQLDGLYAVEGVAYWMPDIEERLADPARRDLVLELAACTEQEPSTLGSTPHVLAVAHR